MASKTINSVKDIREVLSDLGKRLVHVKNANLCYWKQMVNPDPNFVTVIVFSDLPGFKQTLDEFTRKHDAVIFWKQKSIPIKWKLYTRAALRKLFGDGDTECGICYENCAGDVISCGQCLGRMCTMCTFKIALTEEAVTRILSGDHSAITYQCAECRRTSWGDIKRIYVRVMDRLEEFTPEQQQALLSVKRTDRKFKVRLEEWQRQIKFKNNPNAIWEQTSTGDGVVLHGLKKAEWNGKHALIIGEKRIKNGVIRWPVQLTDGCKSKALLKQSNLMR